MTQFRYMMSRPWGILHAVSANISRGQKGSLAPQITSVSVWISGRRLRTSKPSSALIMAMVSVGFSTRIQRDAIRAAGPEDCAQPAAVQHRASEFLSREPSRGLQAPQHVELCAASDRTEGVRRARHHGPANNLRVVGDQLHDNRPTGRMSEHVYRPAEMLGQRSRMTGGHLGPRDIDVHSRPAAGEEHLEAGACEWPHRAHGQLSLEPRRGIAVVRCTTRKVDQGLSAANRKVGLAPGKDTLPSGSELRGHHNITSAPSMVGCSGSGGRRCPGRTRP